MVLACILSLLISAAVLAGCGGGSSSSNSSQTPEQAALSFYTALQKADANTSWNLMSSDGQKQVGSKSTWETAIKQQATTLGNLKFKVGKATVKGNKATVEMTGSLNGQTNAESVPLIKENGVWKVEMNPPAQ